MQAVFGAEFGPVALYLSGSTIMVDVDGDGSAFGFIEGPVGEGVVDAALRLLEICVDEIPLTRRGWAGPICPCVVPGHRHGMGFRADEDRRSLVLVCPDDPARPLRVIQVC